MANNNELNRGQSNALAPSGRRTNRQGSGIAGIDSLGGLANAGDRNTMNQQRDTGAQVGILRNLEQSAGGRAHRVSKGPYSKS